MFVNPVFVTCLVMMRKRSRHGLPVWYPTQQRANRKSAACLGSKGKQPVFFSAERDRVINDLDKAIVAVTTKMRI